MNPKILLSLLALSIPTVASASQDAQLLTGDTRLACEAILCLAGGSGVSECQPSIRKFFSIHYKKPQDTVRGRVNFLNLCPTKSNLDTQQLVEKLTGGSSEKNDADLNKFKNVLSKLTHSCTKESLNNMYQYGLLKNGTRVIRTTNTMGQACIDFYKHGWAGQEMPKYICDNKRYSFSEWKKGYYEESISFHQYSELSKQPNQKLRVIRKRGELPRYLVTKPVIKTCWQ